jgi:hypothetical protein
MEIREMEGRMEYVNPITKKAYSVADCAIIDGYRQSLMDGSVFVKIALSSRSAIGYRPPITYREWSHCMTTISQMAGKSNEFAQIANAILGRVNLYGTPPDARAQVFDRASDALREGFDDVIGRASPEGGRWSDYHREYKLPTRILLMAWLEEATAPMSESVWGLSWCLLVLAQAEQVTIPYDAFKYIKPPRI